MASELEDLKETCNTLMSELEAKCKKIDMQNRQILVHINDFERARTKLFEAQILAGVLRNQAQRWQTLYELQDEWHKHSVSDMIDLIEKRIKEKGDIT